MNLRSSGILMHISSLPSSYGIGTMGKTAYEFVDFLFMSGQRFWQILPLCPTGYGDSPYQSFSSFAGNPYLIDLEILNNEGYLTEGDYNHLFWGEDNTRVNYGALYTERYKVLRIAADRFKSATPEDFEKFTDENSSWLEDYAVFMALKSINNDSSWLYWEDKYRLRDSKTMDSVREEYSEEIFFWEAVQYLFYKQWKELKEYANSKGIEIIGDLPIYTAMDSADVWANPELFNLDENLKPVYVAGVPPDGFTDDGQLWGNPIFRWDIMQKDNYKWWINRIRHISSMYDVTRIDHFRGFESYYIVPAGEETAKNGKWCKGPGMDFFDSVKSQLGDVRFIAEDLGYLTESAIKLVKDSGYPGMKILQFAFDPNDNSTYLPHNHIKNCVVYTGTHDNDTAIGWMEGSEKYVVDFAKSYMRLNECEGYNWGMIKTAMASVADTVVLQMQDFLGLDNSARMNVPSTSQGNWQWRAKPEDINDELAKKIYSLTNTYRRLNTSVK